jgi:hypothetical protein
MNGRKFASSRFAPATVRVSRILQVSQSVIASITIANFALQTVPFATKKMSPCHYSGDPPYRPFQSDLRQRVTCLDGMVKKHRSSTWACKIFLMVATVLESC